MTPAGPPSAARGRFLGLQQGPTMALKRAAPREVVSLQPFGAALSGARTAAIVKTAAFEAVRLVVGKGSVIPSHKVPGHSTLHCIEGRVRLGLEGGDLDLRAGDWVYLEGGEPHSVAGVEDSSLLLTILFDGSAATR
jgi:quercetin dioxygenase-like cupin family protein